jgi:hypothetical protein
MAVIFNGTTISESGGGFVINGTSVGRVYFNGTMYWRRQNSYSDVRRWCVDHYLYVRYLTDGRVQVAGAEPNQSVHTGRGDCGGYGQGWYTAVDFDHTLYSEYRIQLSAENTGGGGGSFDSGWRNSANAVSWLGGGVVSAYGNSGAAQPQISVTVSVRA